MGILQSLAAAFRRPIVEQQAWADLDYLPILSHVAGMSPAELYRTQPHLRTVISFRARNISQLGLHVFERGEGDARHRVRGSKVGAVLARPNRAMTYTDLIRRLSSDLDLYDAAYWLVANDSSAPSGWTIMPLVADRVVATQGGDEWAPDWYVVLNKRGERVKIDARHVVKFHGYNPSRVDVGMSPIEAARDTIAEQVAAWEYRRQLWQRSGRVGAYLSRPSDAPAWSAEARERFKREWAEFQGSGARAGSTPLLEDGIELKPTKLTAREEQWAEVAKLSLTTVAGLYHINPAMLGLLDGVNKSSAQEYRKQLYTDALGPDLTAIADCINAHVVPMVEGPDPDVFVEFNIAAKLAGSFEEQASVLSTSTGAPWMTVNEARARQNLPPIEGGDGLIVPLNVVAGGQASPQDGGSPIPATVEQLPPPDDTVKAWRARADRTIPAKKGAGVAIDWARWERELAADLTAADFPADSAADVVRTATAELLEDYL